MNSNYVCSCESDTSGQVFLPLLKHKTQNEYGRTSHISTAGRPAPSNFRFPAKPSQPAWQLVSKHISLDLRHWQPEVMAQLYLPDPSSRLVRSSRQAPSLPALVRTKGHAAARCWPHGAASCAPGPGFCRSSSSASPQPKSCEPVPTCTKEGIYIYIYILL